MTREQLFNIIKRIYKPLALIIFATLFIIYFLHNQNDFLTLKSVASFDILVIAFVQILILVVNAAMLISVCNINQLNLPFFEALVVTIKSSAINFLAFMQGGLGYRALYLKNKHKLPLKRFLLLYGANSLIIFAVSSLMGLLGLSLRLWQGQSVDWLVVVVFGSLVLLLFALLIFGKKIKLKTNSKFMARLNKAMAGWQLLAQNNRWLLVMFALATAQSLLMSLVFYIQLSALGVSPSFAGVLIYSGLANISILFSFTPGAIGLREALLIFSQNSLGVDTSTIIISSALDRLVYFGLLILLSLPILFYRPRRPKSFSTK